jgi:hypothetical protein
MTKHFAHFWFESIVLAAMAALLLTTLGLFAQAVLNPVAFA